MKVYEMPLINKVYAVPVSPFFCLFCQIRFNGFYFRFIDIVFRFTYALLATLFPHTYICM